MIGKEDWQREPPDFDTLMGIYQRNPGEFDTLRKRLLNEAVAAAPEHHRPSLERVLERIEEAHSKASTPMEAVIIASRMMHDSVGCLALAWRQAQYQMAGLQAAIVLERYRI